MGHGQDSVLIRCRKDWHEPSPACTMVRVSFRRRAVKFPQTVQAPNVVMRRVRKVGMVTYQNLRKPAKSTAGGFTSTLSRYCKQRRTVVREYALLSPLGDQSCSFAARAISMSRQRTSRVWYSLIGLMKRWKSKSSKAPPPTHRYSLHSTSLVPAHCATCRHQRYTQRLGRQRKLRRDARCHDLVVRDLVVQRDDTQ